MRLRPYQKRAVVDLLTRLEQARVVAVAPTGSGKTVIGAAIVRKVTGRVLWVAHRIELLRQARRALIEAGLPAKEVGILSGPDKINIAARVLVASVDTLRSRDVPRVDLIVVDEAHRIAAAGYQTILDASPHARVLGLTATPWRLDGKGLGQTFGDLVIAARQAELIADGFLAMPVTYGVPRERAREMVSGVGSDAGDYAVGQLGRAMMRGTLMGDVVAECARLAPGERTLVFATSREHGRALAERFVAASRRVALVDGLTPALERDRIIARLSVGEIEVVVNVDVLTEGFDCPAVKCVALARPTKSLTRYLQYTGRAARPFDGKRAIILDHAGNAYRHGLPQIDREWTLEGRETNSSDAPVKRCGGCGAMIATRLSVCPECGAEQPRSEREQAEEAAELEQVRATAAERERVREALSKIATARGLSKDWIEQALIRVTEAV